jgi:tetratricopeptide (TPR) repeat protein
MKFYYGFPPALMGLSIALVQPQIAVAQSSADVAKIGKEITVLIDSENPGSGVIIKREGNTYTVMTAAHVLRKPDIKYEIVTNDEKRYLLKYSTVKFLPNTDLAVLQFTSNINYSVAKIGKSETATEGTTAYVAGYPIAKSKTLSRSIYNFTRGEITANATKALEDGYGLVYSNNTLPGMSGGPVLNEKGELVGIHGKGDDTTVTFKPSDINPNIRFKSGFNLGISINTGLQLLATIGVDLGVRPTNVQTAAAPKADDFFIQGLDKYKKGDYPGAIASYTEAIKLNPKYAQAYYRRGEAQLDSGNKQKGIEDLQKAADFFAQQGKKADAKRSEGTIRILSDDFQGAISPLTEAIKFNPNDADAYSFLGAVRTAMGDIQGAFEDLDQAIRLDPNSAYAYSFRGQLRASLGDANTGLEDANEGIRLNPNYVYSYSARGSIRAHLKDFQGALADYNQAIRLTPNNAEAYSNRGDIRVKLKDNKGALADFNEAIRLDPKYADAYIGRGKFRYQSGDKQGAIADFNEAISRNQNNAFLYLKMGVARNELGDKKGAFADFNESIRLAPKNALAYLQRANIRNELGDKKGALADISQAISLQPKNGFNYYLRGAFRVGSADLKGGLADLNEAIRLNPKLAEAYGLRGTMRVLLIDVQGGLADLNQAIRLNPNYTDAYKLRAQVRQGLGDKKGAAADLKEVERLSSQNTGR